MILNFLSLKRIIARFKGRIISGLWFGYENGFVCPVQLSDEKFEDCMDLLLIRDGNIPHYVYIKVLTDLCALRQNRNKNRFRRYCLQCFSSENYW